jgi:predicted enzyme related to lactoylglutathione lyase
MWSHGNFYWNELNTRNPDAAKKFYAATLGWNFEGMPMPDGTYWVAKLADAPVGGIFTMSGPMFDGIPEHWFSYVAVDNVDQRVSTLKAAGGSVIKEAFDVPNVGRIAIVKDANGAVLGMMTPVGN